MKYVLGVDPGLSGAICLLSIESGRKSIIDLWDMPLRDFGERGCQANGFRKSAKNEIDIYGLGLIIDSLPKNISFSVIEEVGVMTGKEGRVSMFNFGKSAGMVQGALGVCNIPIHFVRPAVWKSLMGLGRDKNDSIKLASSLFPQDQFRWLRKKDDGRAEAALLAAFGAERFL